MSEGLKVLQEAEMKLQATADLMKSAAACYAIATSGMSQAESIAAITDLFRAGIILAGNEEAAAAQIAATVAELLVSQSQLSVQQAAAEAKLAEVKASIAAVDTPKPMNPGGMGL